MLDLELAERLGKEKSAPIGHAAHDAFVVKNNLAGRFGDSERRIVRRGNNGGVRRRMEVARRG